MKTLSFENEIPIAAAIFATAVAFATASIQIASSKFAPKTGYILSDQNECNIPISCCDVPSAQICRSWYPNGPIAFGKNPQGQCIQTLWLCYF
ncbi:hypothetical protein [[Flexibacter] sp. ATCC 35103]|uniref:hypothetical protein n=1 Tax=[Flexibacter] sp. ATCC 35103 TaxID=1937528 RepID=UPI0009C574E3|nr:hypothetical protein [[Flexibacter] sp. ATCC 35103]OMQ11505.1 hypothetical protein BXU01_08130 [[Flexibacter] sp. ATCC 35103]